MKKTIVALVLLVTSCCLYSYQYPDDNPEDLYTPDLKTCPCKQNPYGCPC